jgi:hypothetical protein
MMKTSSNWALVTNPQIIAPVMALAVTSACAGPRATGAGTRPDDMTADEHRVSARRHDEIGRQGPYLRGRAWAPWTYSWDPATEHLAERDAHLAAAETLETRYRKACADVPVGAESGSPLSGRAISASPIDGGVLLLLDPAAGPPDQVLAEIRCHRAWLVLEDRPGLADDVVALDHVRYSAQVRDEAIELRVTARSKDQVEELRRRASAAVPASKDAP